MKRSATLGFALLLLAPLTSAMGAPAAGEPEGPPAAMNDYPTAARADYVFACMQSNGGTHEALDRCSCAIDVIASILPYKVYEEADTVLQMQRTTGYLASEFRTAAASDVVRRLREAQAEATVRCF